MVGLLVESRGQSFEAHLPTFLPLLSECLLMQHEYSDNDEEEVREGVGSVTMAVDKTVAMAIKDEVDAVAAEIDKVMANGGVDSVGKDNGDDEMVNEEGFTHDDETESEAVVVDERSLDHFLFGVVQVLCKVFTVCVVVRSPVHRATINCILGEIHTHTLTHTHTHTQMDKELLN